jgi:hypothetical protein
MSLAQVEAAVLATVADLVPIALVILLFQALILRERPPRLRALLIGAGYVFVGLTLFRLGLETALIPIGGVMAEQLADLGGAAVIDGGPRWHDYLWLYAFAAAIGFAATLVEPTLIAVAHRVHDLTGGAIRSRHLRTIVALGVAAGLTLGCVRIVAGVALEHVLAAVLLVVLVQSWFAPRAIVPLAYDTGAVATSVVTVPLIAALGAGVAQAVPGRAPLVDGFGLVVLALLGPVVSLLAFTTVRGWWRRGKGRADAV